MHFMSLLDCNPPECGKKKKKKKKHERWNQSSFILIQRSQGRLTAAMSPTCWQELQKCEQTTKPPIADNYIKTKSN